MVVAAQPICHVYTEIAPGDTVPLLDADGTQHLAERAPLYDTSSITDPTNAIWFATDGDDAHGDGTQGKPYATPGKAITVIEAGATTKWAVGKTGRYRTTWAGASLGVNSKCLGIRGGKNQYVWLDGGKVLTGGSFVGSGPYTFSGVYKPTFNQTPNPKGHQVFLDGVPLIMIFGTGTPGAGQAKVNGTTLVLGDNPAGKVVEYSDLGTPHGAIHTTGFTLAYVGWCRWADGGLSFDGQNQALDHVVGAYTNSAPAAGFLLATRGTKNFHHNQVILTHGGAKTWDTYQDDGRILTGMRVDSSNWRQNFDVSPSGTASLAGAKHSACTNSLDVGIMYRKCHSNGDWYDVRCKNNRTISFAYLDCARYGGTNEVSSVRTLCDGVIARCGLLTTWAGDGVRMSGVEKPEMYNVLSYDNASACIAFYEDARQYAGATTAERSLATPGLGDTYGSVLQGCVTIRTKRSSSKGGFFSINGVVPPLDGDGDGWGDESSAHGWAQTAVLTTQQMFAPNPNASTLTFPKWGPNVYIDLTAAAKTIQHATPDSSAHYVLSFKNGVPAQGVKVAQSGNCTKTTLYSLAELHAISTDIEKGSVEIHDNGAALTKYLPHSADTVPAFSWRALTNIPGTATAVPTYLPPDWVADALGIVRGTMAKVGPYNAPVPQQIASPTAFSITNTDLADGVVGQTYDQQIEVAGTYTGPVRYTSSSLPNKGVHCDPDGTDGADPAPAAGHLYGSPSAATDQLVVKITATSSDSPPKIDTATFTIKILATPPLTIVTSSPVPAGEVGEAFTAAFQASVPCSGWTKTAGTLPPGLTLTAGFGLGALSGSPTTPGTYTYTIQADDGAGHTATKQFTQTINPAPVPPDVATLTSPVDGAMISGNAVPISANAHDPADGHNVTVELLVNGNSLATPKFLIYSGSGDDFDATLDTTTGDFTDADYPLSVKVTNQAGLFTISPLNTVTVTNGGDTTPPTVTSFTLSDGQEITGVTGFSVDVDDPAGVQRVELHLVDEQGNEFILPLSP